MLTNNKSFDAFKAALRKFYREEEKQLGAENIFTALSFKLGLEDEESEMKLMRAIAISVLNKECGIIDDKYNDFVDALEETILELLAVFEDEHSYTVVNL